jgi:hypothetical protein
MKVESAYPTLQLGVSQQAPSVRLPGQHAEQDNMLPDPVQGLTRRPGSLFQALTEGAVDGLTLPSMRQHAFSYANKDYLVMAPEEAYEALGTPCVVYNVTDKIFLPVVFDPSDTGIQTLMESGLSAITSVGKYVFASSNDGRMLVNTTTLWDDTGVGVFGKAALWVRAGVYSRTIKVTVTKADDSVVDFEYTTPSSAYAGILDTSHVPVFAADPAGGTQTDSEAAYIVQYPEGAATGRHELNWYEWQPATLSVERNGVALTNVHPAVPSGASQYAWDSTSPRYILFDFHTPDIPLTIEYTHTKTIPNPNYSKIVSDITNAYNSALTQWIVTSAEAIQAASIAEQLRLAAVAEGCTVSRDEGHLFFESVKSVIVDDGGDGSLVLAVANSIQDVADLTKKHWVGKVVRVRPISSSEAFYMQAVAANDGDTGWADVKWIEGAAYKHQLSGGLLYGTPDGGNFYIASSAATLAFLLPGTHPDYTASAAGDNDTAPLPYFVGRQISYLGIFQDRLLVGSGAVIRASKVGDYLNFFRSSVLTTRADDPLEMLSQGTDDDVIRFGCLYNRSLVLFGKRQYMISGAIALTPTSAIMPVLSSHSGADDVQPVAAGGYIFYVKRNLTGSGVHQLQPGRNSDEAESFPISAQLDSYIPPNTQSLIDVPSPSMLIARSAEPNKLWVYKYLDTPEGRLQGAWYRWTYGTACGQLVGAWAIPEGVLLIWQRGTTWVADVQPLNADDRTRPYLDSIVPYMEEVPRDAAAFDRSSQFYLFGEVWENVPDLIDTYGTDGLLAGYLNDSFVTLSPVYARDRQDKARLSGRTVVTNVSVKTKDSAGFTAVIVDTDREETIEQTYNAELEGLADPDEVSLTSELVPVSIGCETEAYTLTLKARDWLPLTISSILWTGQYFNSTPRI